MASNIRSLSFVLDSKAADMRTVSLSGDCLFGMVEEVLGTWVRKPNNKMHPGVYVCLQPLCRMPHSAIKPQVTSHILQATMSEVHLIEIAAESSHN